MLIAFIETKQLPIKIVHQPLPHWNKTLLSLPEVNFWKTACETCLLSETEIDETYENQIRAFKQIVGMVNREVFVKGSRKYYGSSN